MGWFLQFLDKTPSSRTVSEKKPEDTRQKISQQQKKQAQPKNTDPLKVKGDAYERHIGNRFEEKGDLVIYNGFIRDYADGGVDIATVSPDAKILNLIQCKHWSVKAFELEHVETIYEKLETHNLDFLRLDVVDIIEHLSIKKQKHEIEEMLAAARKNKKDLQVRKTLYISSDKVVNLEIGKHLTMMQPNIFRYRDMKIVVEVCP